MALLPVLGKTLLRRRSVERTTGSTYAPPGRRKPGCPGSHGPGGEYGYGPADGGRWMAPSSTIPCACASPGREKPPMVPRRNDAASINVRMPTRMDEPASRGQDTCPDPESPDDCR